MKAKTVLILTAALLLCGGYSQTAFAGFPHAREWQGNRYVKDSFWISSHLDLGAFHQALNKAIVKSGSGLGFGTSIGVAFHLGHAFAVPIVLSFRNFAFVESELEGEMDEYKMSNMQSNKAKCLLGTA